MIRTDHGTKLLAALGGPVVFEVDHLDEDSLSGWSVMVHGTARLSGGREERPGSQNRVLRPWPEAERPHLLRIVAKKVTGRRISTSRAHRWLMAGASSSALRRIGRSNALVAARPKPGCLRSWGWTSSGKWHNRFGSWLTLEGNDKGCLWGETRNSAGSVTDHAHQVYVVSIFTLWIRAG